MPRTKSGTKRKGTVVPNKIIEPKPERIVYRGKMREEYVFHLTGMGSANLKIANSNIFVQNLGKITLKPIAVIKTPGPTPSVKAAKQH